MPIVTFRVRLETADLQTRKGLAPTNSGTKVIVLLKFPCQPTYLQPLRNGYRTVAGERNVLSRCRVETNPLP
jgi:hypothetical protein